MAHSNGIITAPVSFGDVNATLGTSHTDLYTMCRDDNIKRLSPYKPIRGNIRSQADTPNVLSDDDFINRDMGYLIPTFSGQNFAATIKGIVDNTNQWSTIPSAGDTNTRGSIGNGWVYNMPIPNTNFARLSDFRYYDHNCNNSYQSNTYEVLAGTKIVYTGGSYTAKFFVKMNPLSPNMFRTLIGYRLGVAIYSPNVSNGAVFFYVGTGSGDLSAITTASVGVTECSVIMPSTLFDEIIGRASGSSDIIFNAVGFFAPAAYGGYQNILSSYSGYQANPSAMNSLIPLAGSGYDTFVWKPSSTDTTYLSFSCGGSVIRVGQTSGQGTIYSVTNSSEVYGTGTFYLRNLITYTYEIKNTNDVVVYSRNTHATFGSIGIIDVSNTQQGEHKTTAVDISGNISLPDASYSVEGYKLVVTLWYPKGVDPQNANNGRGMAGQFTITITDNVPPRE